MSKPTHSPSPEIIELEEVSSRVYPSLERKPGKQNWVDKAGGLPSYIERIAKHLHYEKGKPIGTAIASAVATTKRWCTTGKNWNGGDLKADTQAKACKAVTEWEAKRAKSKAKTAASKLKESELVGEEELAEVLPALRRRLEIVEALIQPLGFSNCRMGTAEAAGELLESVTSCDQKLKIGGRRLSGDEAAEVRRHLAFERADLRSLIEAMGGDPDAGPVDEAEAVMKRVKKASQKSPNTKGQGLDLKRGDGGDNVRNAQSRLVELGYEIKPDGEFGPQTENVVKSFQGDHGLEVDGKLGRQTRTAMRGTTPADITSRRNEASAKQAEETQAKKKAEAQATAGPPSRPFDWLTKGRGVDGEPDPEVQRRQEQLTSMGTFVGDTGADGRFGPETEMGVKRVQRRYGLKADGLIGPKTGDLLDRVSAGERPEGGNPGMTRNEPEEPGESAREDAGESEADEKLEESFSEADHKRAPKGDPNGGQFVQMGDDGSEVTGVQSKLGVDTTGKFDKETVAAVKKYQRENDLLVDGIVGRQTAASMQGREATPGELSRADKRFLRRSGRDIQEASLRGSVEHIGRNLRDLLQIKRLPDGTFAPKGRGQILYPGQTVSVPNRDPGKPDVPGRVGKGGKVELLDGPDKGQRINVKPNAPDPVLDAPADAPVDARSDEWKRLAKATDAELKAELGGNPSPEVAELIRLELDDRSKRPGMPEVSQEDMDWLSDESKRIRAEGQASPGTSKLDPLWERTANNDMQVVRLMGPGEKRTVANGQLEIDKIGAQKLIVRKAGSTETMRPPFGKTWTEAQLSSLVRNTNRDGQASPGTTPLSDTEKRLLTDFGVALGDYDPEAYNALVTGDFANAGPLNMDGVADSLRNAIEAEGGPGGFTDPELASAAKSLEQKLRSEMTKYPYDARYPNARLTSTGGDNLDRNEGKDLLAQLKVKMIGTDELTPLQRDNVKVAIDKMLGGGGEEDHQILRELMAMDKGQSSPGTGSQLTLPGTKVSREETLGLPGGTVVRDEDGNSYMVNWDPVAANTATTVDGANRGKFLSDERTNRPVNWPRLRGKTFTVADTKRGQYSPGTGGGPWYPDHDGKYFAMIDRDGNSDEVADREVRANLDKLTANGPVPWRDVMLEYGGQDTAVRDEIFHYLAERGLISDIKDPDGGAVYPERWPDPLPPGTRSDGRILDKPQRPAPAPLPSPKQKQKKPMVTHDGKDFAMFSPEGNASVRKQLDELTKNGPVKWQEVVDALDKVGDERSDTAVREEAGDYLGSKGLISDLADNFREPERYPRPQGQSSPGTGVPNISSAPTPTPSGEAKKAAAAVKARMDADTRPKIDCGSDVNKAADLLSGGQRVQLDQPRTVSILLEELDKRVKAAIAMGDEAPSFNLCDISVPNTNLFCAESKGVARVNMPQLSGVPLPGSKGDKLPKNDKGEIDLSGLFREMLEGEGVKFEDTTEKAAYLRATQNELNGAKVAGIVGAMRSGVEIGGSPLFVSSDNYIVDGHHRWAANVGMDSLDGKLAGGDDEGMPMEVQRIDMDIIELLERSNAFAAEYGIPQAGVGDNRHLGQKSPGTRPQAIRTTEDITLGNGYDIPAGSKLFPDSVVNSSGPGSLIVDRVRVDPAKGSKLYGSDLNFERDKDGTWRVHGIRGYGGGGYARGEREERVVPPDSELHEKLEQMSRAVAEYKGQASPGTDSDTVRKIGALKQGDVIEVGDAVVGRDASGLHVNMQVDAVTDGDRHLLELPVDAEMDPPSAADVIARVNANPDVQVEGNTRAELIVDLRRKLGLGQSSPGTQQMSLPGTKVSRDEARGLPGGTIVRDPDGNEYTVTKDPVAERQVTTFDPGPNKGTFLTVNETGRPVKWGSLRNKELTVVGMEGQSSPGTYSEEDYQGMMNLQLQQLEATDPAARAELVRRAGVATDAAAWQEKMAARAARREGQASPSTNRSQAINNIERMWAGDRVDVGDFTVERGTSGYAVYNAEGGQEAEGFDREATVRLLGELGAFGQGRGGLQPGGARWGQNSPSTGGYHPDQVVDSGDPRLTIPTPIEPVDNDGIPDETAEWLNAIPVGSNVEDANGNAYNVLDYGPVQGSMTLFDKQSGLPFYADGSQKLKVVDNGEGAGLGTRDTRGTRPELVPEDAKAFAEKLVHGDWEIIDATADVRTFEDDQMLTNQRGVTVYGADGSQYQLSIDSNAPSSLAQDLETDLQNVLTGQADLDWFIDKYSMETFEEAGLMTDDHGVVVRPWDSPGKTMQVTIMRSRNGQLSPSTEGFPPGARPVFSSNPEMNPPGAAMPGMRREPVPEQKLMAATNAITRMQVGDEVEVLDGYSVARDNDGDGAYTLYAPDGTPVTAEDVTYSEIEKALDDIVYGTDPDPMLNPTGSRESFGPGQLSPGTGDPPKRPPYGFDRDNNMVLYDSPGHKGGPPVKNGDEVMFVGKNIDWEALDGKRMVPKGVDPNDPKKPVWIANKDGYLTLPDGTRRYDPRPTRLRGEKSDDWAVKQMMAQDWVVADPPDAAATSPSKWSDTQPGKAEELAQRLGMSVERVDAAVKAVKDLGIPLDEKTETLQAMTAIIKASNFTDEQLDRILREEFGVGED